MQTTAAVLREFGKPLSIETVEIEDPQEGEVRVAMRACGVCHTDLGVAAGGAPVELPIVLGHEGAGVVEAVGSGVDDLAEGDHVVLSFGSCGRCRFCQRDHPAYCESFVPLNLGGVRPDGTTSLAANGDQVHSHFFVQSSFAAHAIATARNAVKVPDDAPLEKLGPLGCGILTGAGTVLKALKPEEGQSLAVFGTGGVGLAALMAAKAAGCDPLVAVDLNPARLELAQELGATHTFKADDGNPVEQIVEATGGGVDFTVEAVGLGPVIRQALECLGLAGTCATVGFQGMQNEITIDQGHMFLGGRTLSGVVEGDADPQQFIPEMVALWQDGRFPFDRLIQEFPFEQINEAFAASEWHNRETTTITRATLTP